MKSFTLLELIIVVVVVSILAAIGIPSLIETRKIGNETNAISYMRSWLVAQDMYKNRHGVYADADDDLVREGLLGVEDGNNGGYIFALDNDENPNHWWGRGWPEQPGYTGDRYFYIDSSGVVRYTLNAHATKHDSPLR